MTAETDTPCTCLRKAAVDHDAFRRAARSREAAADDAPVAGESAKVCRVCGTDVTGKKRYKDTLGYWCVDCHRKEKAKRTAGQERCGGCGRMFPREKLRETGVDLLCSTCNKERIARQREMIRSAEKTHIHSGHQKRQLFILVGIFLLLALLILLSRMGVL